MLRRGRHLNQRAAAAPPPPEVSRSTHGASIQKRQLRGAKAAAGRNLACMPESPIRAEPRTTREGLREDSHPHPRPPAAALRRARPPPSDVGRAPHACLHFRGMDANDAAAPCTSIWRPSRELLADARAASERGDAETACRLGWAACMHASTRGNSNPKYALSDNAFKAAMEIAVKAGEVHGCDFEAITCAINVEIASDNERPATGPEASAANRLAQQARDDEETSFPVPLARLPDGARVRVKGLTSREDLNGRLGTILSHISNCDRYAVQIEGSGECVRLRSDTVSPIESRPADAPMAGALVEAARAGHLKKLRNLVKLGADVNGTGLGRGGRP